MKLGPVKQHLQGSRSYLLWSLKLSWSEVADLHVKCGTLHNAVWSSPFLTGGASLAGQTDPTGGVKGGQESLEASNKGVSRKCFESQTLCLALLHGNDGFPKGISVSVNYFQVKHVKLQGCNAWKWGLCVVEPFFGLGYHTLGSRPNNIRCWLILDLPWYSMQYASQHEGLLMHSCWLILHRRETSNGNLMGICAVPATSVVRIWHIWWIGVKKGLYRFCWFVFWIAVCPVQDMVVHPINAESEDFVADQKHPHSGDHDARNETYDW